MQCGGFIRTSTMILNLVFLVSGIFLISFGAYSLRQDVGLLHSVSLGAGIIVLGVLVSLVSFFGCWGSIRQSRISLIIYISVIVIIVLIEIILGIVAYAKRDSISEIADSSWTKLYASDRGAILDIETTFKCCGWLNDSDRAVPPRDDKDLKSCVSTFPDFAGSACSAQPATGDKTWSELYEYSRASILEIEKTYKCCGWFNDSDRAVPPENDADNSTCIDIFPENARSPCSANANAATAAWYALTSINVGEAIGIEYNFKCCGWLNDTDHAVPPRDSTDLNTCVSTFPTYMGISCNQKIVETIHASLVAVGGCAIGIGVIQVICLLFSCYLLIKIPKEPKDDTDIFLDSKH